MAPSCCPGRSCPACLTCKRTRLDAAVLYHLAGGYSASSSAQGVQLAAIRRTPVSVSFGRMIVKTHREHLLKTVIL